MNGPEQPIQMRIQSGDHSRTPPQLHEIVQFQAETQAGASRLLDMCKVDGQVITFWTGIKSLLDVTCDSRSELIIDSCVTYMYEHACAHTAKVAMEFLGLLHEGAP